MTIWSITTRCSFIALTLFLLSGTTAAQIPGFTEAFRTVEVASGESGVVSKILVKVGDKLTVGDPIAELDSTVQQAQLELAQHFAQSKAELDKANAELRAKQMMLDHLQRLRDKGYAQSKELVRSEMELEISKANVLARHENMTEASHRLKLAQINLDRRVIRSPVDGFVSELHRDPGEFISPVNPKVVTVLQVDPIIARFQVNVVDINRVKIGQRVLVSLDNRQRIEGTVDSIGVVADSETIAVKVLLANDKNKIRSGQRCYFKLPSEQQVTKN